MITTVEAKAREVVEQLGGQWRGRSGVCRCPAHEDRTPSLSVQVGETWPLFRCFAGCKRDAIITSLLKAGINPFAGLNHARTLATTSKQSLRLPNYSQVAKRLWNDSTGAVGTPAERYLIARAIGEVASQFRFHARCPLGSGQDLQRLPALIAPVHNEFGIVAVQRTFLDTAQILRKPFKKNKMVLGQPSNGAIRLATPTDELGLAEGLEDAASAQHITSIATWAIMGTQRLIQINIPQRVRHVIVFGQNNLASRNAFTSAKEQLTTRFDSVVYRTPPNHEDWNDWLRAG